MKWKAGISSLLISSLLGAGTTIFAAETAPPAELPQAWAQHEVSMSTVYGLKSPQLFNKYTSPATVSDFNVILNYLSWKFAGGKAAPVSLTKLSRNDALQALYQFIQKIHEKNGQLLTAKAVPYLHEHKIYVGSNSTSYNLNTPITKQELLTLYTRVYEHLTYSNGQGTKGMYWKVSDEDNTVYLLGSIHVGDGSIYPLSEVIRDGYADAEVIAVEANMLQIQNDAEYIQKKSMFEGDTTIDQVLPKETYDAYVKAIAPLGLTPEVYNKFEPWYAALIMQSIHAGKADYSANYGIDLYFLSMATGKKPIVELEGARFQIDMFDNFSQELQVKNLQGLLENHEQPEQTADVMKQLMTAWKAGDDATLEKLVLIEPKDAVAAEINDKIWLTRNANMTAKITKMLTDDQEKDYFVVVGAGHMLNESGIVNQLKKQGYTVEKP
ncbi:TraB/GumN family protein [Paenibacillus swuensis]|uniref:TraB/GumN family protein n=1 Tax=Paenibacillus swuensis TaxID=1178515 RepID=UPI0008396E2F|nr:TraB/GumN family protein [Paenibacillus swuensis]